MNLSPKKIEQWNFSSDATDFHCFLKVDKFFWGLPIVEIGSPGFSIDEVSFHSFSINHINFPGFTFKGTNFHALHLCEIVSQGEPVSEKVLVFFHHWWRQFPWILLRRNKLHEHSFDDFQFDWLQINLIGFHWLFFQSKRYPRNFNQWNRFLRKSYTRAFSQNLPVTEVSLMEFNSIKTVFFS